MAQNRLTQYLAHPLGKLVCRFGRQSLLLIVSFSLLSAPAYPQESVPLEERVKAAYLAKIPAYVSWPEGAFSKPDAPLVFGVIGDDQVTAELTRAVAGREVDGHPMTVRRLKDEDSIANIHVLFVGGSDNPRLAQEVRSTGKQPVLLVTDSAGALDRGSMVNFVLVDDHVKFDIALDTTEKHGLKLSSRLLGVAHNVRAGSGVP
jgi:hypothetical protein